VARGGAGARFVESGGPYLGLEPALTFPERTLELADGERFYLLTDGLTEALSPTGEVFGEERVSALAEEATTASVELATRLMPALSAFVGEGNTLSDDVTVVGLRPRVTVARD
jgi:serine phosphatase RsbU (regulator of sigma subunit)